MKLKGKMPYELQVQINKCLDLLGKEYTSMNFTIEVYLNREKIEHERKYNPLFEEKNYIEILDSNHVIGQVLSEQKIIRFYFFNLDNTINELNYKLEIVGNLFHEIRHIWQVINNLFLDEPKINNIKENREAYFSLPSEKDAYTFQKEMMNKHKEAITKIMKMGNTTYDYRLRDDIEEIINN